MFEIKSIAWWYGDEDTVTEASISETGEFLFQSEHSILGLKDGGLELTLHI